MARINAKKASEVGSTAAGLVSGAPQATCSAGLVRHELNICKARTEGKSVAASFGNRGGRPASSDRATSTEIAEALDALRSSYSVSIGVADALDDGLLAAAAFYAHNYVRLAVLLAGTSAEPALVAASFLTSYYQTKEGRRWIPEGRMLEGVLEEVTR